MKTQLPLSAAQQFAGKIVAALEPGCERIAVAGSIRRGAPGSGVVGDIEIVAIPRRAAGLFPDQPGASLLDPILDELVQDRCLHLVKGGERFKQYTFPRLTNHGCLQLDLFLVTAETWGVQLAIRTGPADFSRALVTERIRGGRLPDGHAVREGRVWPPRSFVCGMLDAADYHGPFFQPVGPPLVTPEERDFLELAGGWLPPEDRRVDQPIRESAEIPEVERA